MGVSISYKPNPALTVKVGKNTAQRLRLAAIFMQDEIKKTISTQAPTESGGGYKASAPNTPPFARTGTLRNSIKHEKQSEFTYVVGPSVAYGRFLEFGTRRMEQRPFVRPTLARVKKEFASLFKGLF